MQIKLKFFSFIKVRCGFWIHHTCRMRVLVKIFNSLHPLIFFIENCKTYRNLVKPVSICKRTTVKPSSSVKFIFTFSITLITFTIVFYCLERPLKIVMENDWIKNHLPQINLLRFWLSFERWLLSCFPFCNHLTEAENTPKHFTKKSTVY